MHATDRYPAIATRFTLIELLVVVSIIAVLAAMLFPVFARTKERAKNTICVANLRTCGQAFSLYAMDNEDELMISARPFGLNGGVLPLILQAEPNVYGEVNPVQVNEYLPVFNLQAKSVHPGNPFYCPFADTAYMRDVLGTYRWKNWGWFDIGYSYFAGVSNWSSFAYGGAATGVTDNEPVADRILMADILAWQSDNNLMAYNHSPLGWVWSNAAAGTYVDPGGSPSCSGMNRLYGDGSVNWKPISEFDSAQMGTPYSYAGPWVRGGTVRATYY